MPSSPVILHVDDDPDIREIVLVALELVGGLTVIQCANGQDAVDAVRNNRPDLFLLDVMMPDMDGVQTLKNLREISGFESIPAFFMTAKVQDEDIKNLMKAGASGVIPKPFDTTTLSDELISRYDAVQGAA